MIVFYHIFPLFTHCCLTTQKNKKIGTIISIFQKYFWGYAGVWLECEMNDWLTLWMFGWYWFSLCAQPKTKKEIFSIFTTRWCLMAEVVWKVSIYVRVPRKELQLGQYHLRFHCCVYNKPPVNTVLKLVWSHYKSIPNVYNVMNKFSDWLKIKIVKIDW